MLLYCCRYVYATMIELRSEQYVTRYAWTPRRAPREHNILPQSVRATSDLESSVNLLAIASAVCGNHRKSRIFVRVSRLSLSLSLFLPAFRGFSVLYPPRASARAWDNAPVGTTLVQNRRFYFVAILLIPTKIFKHELWRVPSNPHCHFRLFFSQTESKYFSVQINRKCYQRF